MSDIQHFYADCLFTSPGGPQRLEYPKGNAKVYFAADYDARATGEQKAIEYSIKLQRLIENLKYETEPRYPELHHHKMIVAAKARIARLEEALKLIADGTVCPDLFPNETNEDALAAKTAMTIALAALEVSASQSQREAK